ncbi:MAG: hypothetical protein E6R05_02555 [Candidatus Moraniibacteriota bacterium]|nr:MAG: hypothetical protein E6R05_02555 [Candidatus Moranbacteria bacterium]
MAEKKLTPKWKQYLEVIRAENRRDLEEEAINYINGESGSWRDYAEAAVAISKFLMDKTRRGEEITIDVVPPAMISAIITTSVELDGIATWDSNKWRDYLLFAKNRLQDNSRKVYPAPGAENDGGGNVWGSIQQKFNTHRGKQGEDLD